MKKKNKIKACLTQHTALSVHQMECYIKHTTHIQEHIHDNTMTSVTFQFVPI